MTEVSLGQTVIFCDPEGNDHEALVTAVWSQECVNVVYVSPDESETDSYGRQIKRSTSVPRGNRPWVHGNYFRTVDEEKIPYKAPEQV